MDDRGGISGGHSTSPAHTQVSVLIERAVSGESRASEELLPLVYHELRAMAAAQMQHQPSGHTLQPTALVHEAYLKLIGSNSTWRGRREFFAAAAHAMRHILIDRARRVKALKHGAGQRPASLDENAVAIDPTETSAGELLLLDQALQQLQARDPRQVEIVMLRYFAGLSIEETAAAMDLSTATIKAEWAHARAWLRRSIELASHSNSASGGESRGAILTTPLPLPVRSLVPMLVPPLAHSRSINVPKRSFLISTNFRMISALPHSIASLAPI